MISALRFLLNTNYTPDITKMITSIIDYSKKEQISPELMMRIKDLSFIQNFLPKI